ncbi:MAG TPA: glycosyltransferase [Smithellaceae bacterium]|nr:glycosyltransferase [Smithellaceae bacterium]
MEFFSYTEPDAANLRAQFPGRIVHSTNNGLDQVSIDRAKCSYPLASLTAFKSKLGLEGKRIALSLGRALPGRFNLMVPVLREMKRRDADFRWILLGDGDGIATLKAELKSFGVSDLAILVGAVYGEAELAKWFGIADLFVYPDAIGLSLYHAYGYGLPVIVHSNYAFHGPEMGTFKEGLTGLTFEPGNASHMAEQIVRLLNDDGRRNKMNTHVLEIVHNLYNSEIMFERFTRALLEPVSVL